MLKQRQGAKVNKIGGATELKKYVDNYGLKYFSDCTSVVCFTDEFTGNIGGVFGYKNDTLIADKSGAWIDVIEDSGAKFDDTYTDPTTKITFNLYKSNNPLTFALKERGKSKVASLEKRTGKSYSQMKKQCQEVREKLSKTK